MAISNCDVSLISSPLSFCLPEWSEESGGVVDFWGVVRASEGGRRIVGIDYEAHAAMARHQLQMIAEKAAADFELTGVVLTHRIGFVPVAAPSLFLRAMSRHREAAFAASEWMIEELKRHAPIWKRPVFSVAAAAAQVGSPPLGPNSLRSA